MLFNTELDVDATNPAGALLGVNESAVRVNIYDGIGLTVNLPTTVIEVPAALGSFMVGVPSVSQTALIAVFDIPHPWPNYELPDPTPANPAEFDITIEYNGNPTSGGGTVDVIGENGPPTIFHPFMMLRNLELGPTLRLRPAWDPSLSEGFDPSWNVAGTEFTLRYTQSGTGEVIGVSPVVNGEALPGVAMVAPLPDEGAAKLWKISLVEPQGIEIPHMGCPSPGECYSGRWSLLDLRLETDEHGLTPSLPTPAVVFSADEFAIEDVKVVGPDGVRSNPPFAAGQQFFHAYAANNTAVPEPGSTLQIVFGLLGLLLLNRVHHREQRGRWLSRGK